MATKKKVNIRTLALLAVLSALIFALSMISIPIGDVSRVHFGNIMCLLSGLLFGPFVGGVASGFGSMLYDFTNPLYTPEFWITFLTKFAMGFVAGLLSRKLENKMPALFRYAIAATSGAGLYVLLYLGKSALMQHFVMGTPWGGVGAIVASQGIVSGLNGLIAVVASVVLAPVLRAALDAAGLFKKNLQGSS